MFFFFFETSRHFFFFSKWYHEWDSSFPDFNQRTDRARGLTNIIHFKGASLFTMIRKGLYWPTLILGAYWTLKITAAFIFSISTFKNKGCLQRINVVDFSVVSRDDLSRKANYTFFSAHVSHKGQNCCQIQNSLGYGIIASAYLTVFEPMS